MTPFVRVPERDYGAIGRLLDGGAHGVVAPRIETADQALDHRSSVSVPAAGSRCSLEGAATGYAPTPAMSLNPALDATRSCQIVIETQTRRGECGGDRRARRRRHGAIGASDMTAELGVPGRFDRPEFRDAVATVAEASAPRHAAGGRRGQRPGGVRVLVRWELPDGLTGTDSDLLFGARARVDAMDTGSPVWPGSSDAWQSRLPNRCRPCRCARPRTNHDREFELPAGSCDAHFHVFEPGYPHVTTPYTRSPRGTRTVCPRSPKTRASSGWSWCSRATTAPTTADGRRASHGRASCRGVVRVDEDIDDGDSTDYHDARRSGDPARPVLPRRLADRRDRGIRRRMAAQGGRGLAPAVLHTGTVVRDLLPFLATSTTPS